MEDQEKRAINRTFLALQDDLDTRDVAPFLFQHDHLTNWQFQAIIDSSLPRYKRCQQFITIITSDGSSCTFQGLLAALRYQNVYPFLAEKLEKSLQTVIEYEVSHGAVEQTGNNHRQTQSHDGLPQDFRSREIDVFKGNRVKMTELAHTLKRLSHDGNVDKFRQLVTKVNKIYKRNKLNAAKHIEEKMAYADMRFIALEAEASSRRVNYDVTLYDDPLFQDMESVIPYTTNPRVSSMTYLARYGSAVSMLESPDNGLAILDYSKHHAEHVVPCKETGMVFTIEVDLLSQKYEQEPTTDLKMEILKTAEMAMTQFNGENEQVQKDYQRMLTMNMVFFRLGIGPSGNEIKNVNLDDADKDAIKDYLDFIERSDVWNGMEKRQKMLFQVAKSELYCQSEQYEQALLHAKEAVRVAEENDWKAELPNLRKRLTDLNDEMSIRRLRQSSSIFDTMNRLLDEISDDPIKQDKLETDILRNATVEMTNTVYTLPPHDRTRRNNHGDNEIGDLKLIGDENTRETDQNANMEYLKPPCDQTLGMKHGAIEMEDLKVRTNKHTNINEQLSYLEDHDPFSYQVNGRHYNTVEMELLKFSRSDQCRRKVDRAMDSGRSNPPCYQRSEPNTGVLAMCDLKVKTDETIQTESENLDPHFDRSEGGNDLNLTYITNLKPISCTPESHIISTANLSSLAVSSHNPDYVQHGMSMDLLKHYDCDQQNDDTGSVGTINMDNLKCFYGVQETGCGINTVLCSSVSSASESYSSDHREIDN